MRQTAARKFGLGSGEEPFPSDSPCWEGDEAWGGDGCPRGVVALPGERAATCGPPEQPGETPCPFPPLGQSRGWGCSPGEGAGGHPGSSGSSFSVPALPTCPRHRWGCARRGNSHGAQIPVRAASASRVCQVSGFGAIAKATGELSRHSVYQCFASPGDNAGQFRPRGLRQEPSLSVEEHPRTGLLGEGGPLHGRASPALRLRDTVAVKELPGFSISSAESAMKNSAVASVPYFCCTSRCSLLPVRSAACPRAAWAGEGVRGAQRAGPRSAAARGWAASRSAPVMWERRLPQPRSVPQAQLRLLPGGHAAVSGNRFIFKRGRGEPAHCPAAAASETRLLRAQGHRQRRC